MLNDDKKYDFCSDYSKEEKIIVKDDEEEEEEEDVILCRATDGKGWQCGRIVKKNGHKMCSRHLISGKKLDGTGKRDHLISGKKSDGNGKRGRGRPRMIKKKEPAAQTDENLSEYYYYSGFRPLRGKKKGSGRVNDDNATSISKNEDKNTKKPVPEIDYMECDDDDDDDGEEDGGGDGKKRGRKRIKARSLKSLMRNGFDFR